MSDDPQRQLFHDLRGVIAAANANVEYLREQGVSPALDPVCVEISHELRLVADVIALLGARDPERSVELDLRAMLWLAGRSGPSSAPVRIDPTAPPFPVRGRASVIGALVDGIVRAVAPGAHVSLAVFDDGSRCAVHGLELGRASDGLIAVAEQLGLSPSLDGSTLLLGASRD
jgi:hypothetical protein